MRYALLVLLLAASCSSQCGVVGDGRIGGGVVGSGSVGAGAIGGPNPSPSVVGINWPEGGSYGTVEILWEAAKETSFADTDSVTTPTQFGALSAVAVTQPGAASLKPTYEDPCDVGPAVPCFYFDGGDYWYDSAVRSSLKFLHDGTGASCYLVAEAVATAGGWTWFGTGSWSAAEQGMMMYYTSAATDRTVLYMSDGLAINAVVPSGGTLGDVRTTVAAVSHASARTPDIEVVWRGESSAETGSTSAYTITPTSDDPEFAMYVGKRPGGGAGGQATGYIFAAACYSTYHDNTTMNAVIDAIEAELGAMPQ